MIYLKNVTFQYNDASFAAIVNVNLNIDAGDFVLLTGTSGSGKSTLCRVLNGLVPHFYGGSISGEIEVSGCNPLEVSPGVMATKAGMVFQDPENQLVTSSVEREICFGMENLGLPRDEMARRLEEVLNTLSISHLRHRSINELSGGEKQLTAIASVLSTKPGVIILDEPTSELDPAGAKEVLGALKHLNVDHGLTIIIAEHRLEKIVPHANRIVVMNKGSIAIDGPTRHVLFGKYNELVNLGIGPPPLAELYKRFEDKGFIMNGRPLTVHEGVKCFGMVILKSKQAPNTDYACSQNSLAVELKQVSYTYPNGFCALNNIDLSIKHGEMLAIMGKNASGKTTLIKHLNKLLKPDQGDILINGQDLSSLSVKQVAGLVGMVFQNPNEHFFSDTAEDEIRFGLKNNGTGRDEISEKVDTIMSRFQLSLLRDKPPLSLSGGEKQRLALASVIATYPDLLVLDEPTRGLEEQKKAELMHLLDEYRRTGKTVVVVTHDVELVARFFNRVILMSQGRIVTDGETHAVLSQDLHFSTQINQLVQQFKYRGVPSSLLTANEVVCALP